MAKTKRRSEIIKTNEFDALKPLDVLSLGSEDDPCFGKLHDLLDPNCKICGDSEFCSVVKAQNLHKERLKIETKQRFKDIEEADEQVKNKKDNIKSQMVNLQSQGLKRLKIIIKLNKETGLPKDELKKLFELI